jgi:hypothetical protein
VSGQQGKAGLEPVKEKKTQSARNRYSATVEDDVEGNYM